MVSDVRARLRSEIAAPPGPHGRHLVSGRAIRAGPRAQQYLWRALDEDGDVIDILVPSRRNRRAAARFFRKFLKRQGREPRRLIHGQAPQLFSCAPHRDAVRDPQYLAVRIQSSRSLASTDPPAGAQMRRFKSAAHLQRFASVHGVVQHLFRVGQHLLRVVHYRLLRTRSLGIRDKMTCACCNIMHRHPSRTDSALYSST